MTEPIHDSFTLGEGAEAREIAILRRDGDGPCVVWLGGFLSEMTATKATALDRWAAEAGRAMLRFDYSGHGASGGRFEDGTIGRWLEDAVEAIARFAGESPVLVGSSMGGWMALLAARAMARPPAGLVLIAPAVDFTEELMWAGFSEEVREKIMSEGVWRRPSEYSPDPTPITRRLIEEGRAHLMLGGPIRARCPVHIVQGMEDPDVPWAHALRLVERLAEDDVVVTLIKDGDHRLSRPEDLERIVEAVDGIAERRRGGLASGESPCLKSAAADSRRVIWSGPSSSAMSLFRAFRSKPLLAPAEAREDAFVLPTRLGKVSVSVRRSSQARRMTLRVRSATRDVTLTLPARTPVTAAHDFVRRHVGWIEQRLSRLPERIPFLPGEIIPLRGEARRITLGEGMRGLVRLEPALRGGEPAIAVHGLPEHAARRVADFLKREARADLLAAVDRHAAALGVTIGRVTVKDTTSRWGSCSATGDLSFSWRLVLAPAHVLDYLAAHEVAHRLEMNHGPRYWAHVARLRPDYERSEAWLKAHGATLHRYG